MDTPPTQPAAGSTVPATLHRTGPARIALIGVHGFGAHHLKNLDRLTHAGAVELVAVADPSPPPPGALPDSTAVHPDLQSLLAGNHSPDVVVVATPPYPRAAGPGHPGLRR